MDRNLRGYYGATSGINYTDPAVSVLSDPNLIESIRVNDTIVNQNYVNVPIFQPNPNTNILVPSSENDSQDDYDFSDVVLGYISQILMEEDMEEQAGIFEDSAALQAQEKSFYDVLENKSHTSIEHQLVPSLDQSIGSPDDNYIADYNNYFNNDYTASSGLLCPNWNPEPCEHDPVKVDASVDVARFSTSQPSYSSSSTTSTGTVSDGPVDSPVSTLTVSDIYGDTRSVMQFKQGIEEAGKFLPAGSGLLVESTSNDLFLSGQSRQTSGTILKMEKIYESETSPTGSRGKKNPYYEDVNLREERSSKQSAISSESAERSEMFDMVLLCSGGKNESALREALQNGANKSTPLSGQGKGSNGGKSRGKKQGGKRNVVDLRTLLTLCAQAVATGDQRTANEFMKQIRQHASPTGDGMQRLAHYVANGLEARMAGSGTEIYRAVISLPTSAANVLKAYHLYVATCPFRKISNFFANKTIMNVAEKATRLHIIDFGILYGFQWPCLIQRLSSRVGGPPRLRITGIDLPSPGFRPSERVDGTGARLANYAERFGVPFEFHAIAQKWETIKLEDLKIDKDEVLVVNCLFRLRHLLDETVVVNSPRNAVLNLIREMNPDVFIHGILNGAYNAPFFITRFREALFHFSSLFDMLDANIPREIHERMLLERVVFGRQAMNVIACEAAERIERPETYKQWQARNIRAGFRQLPLDEEIMKMARNRVKSSYHKDFTIDEDGQWLLQGWKGRIIYALSSWKPAW